MAEPGDGLFIIQLYSIILFYLTILKGIESVSVIIILKTECFYIFSFFEFQIFS